MATHSSILAWRIPGTEEPGGLPSMWSHRVRHDWSDLACMHAGSMEYRVGGEDLAESPLSRKSVAKKLLTCGNSRYWHHYVKSVSFINLCLLSHFSCVWLFATPWTIACQVPLSMRVTKQEYWSGLPLPFPGDLPDQGIEPMSPASPALQGGFFFVFLFFFFTTELLGKPYTSAWSLR